MDELDLLDDLLGEHDEVAEKHEENGEIEEENRDRAEHSDSSEEEEERNCFDRKYSDRGLEIRKTLNDEMDSKTRRQEERRLLQDKAKSSWTKPGSAGSEKISVPSTCDFTLKGGIRIVKPLVNEATLYERINNRTILTPSNCNTSEKEIVLMGIVHSSDNRVSAAGNNYTLCVLTDFYKTVQVFLFGQAKNCIKGQIGIAVAVLNPSTMKGSGNDVRFSIDEAARVMVIGGAKDWGRCQATTKAGAPCTSAVNIAKCRFCVHHMSAEYRKASRKSALPMSSLKQKLMGSIRPVPYNSKSERKAGTPIRPTFMNMAKKAKDLEILKALSGKSSRESQVQTKELDNKPPVLGFINKNPIVKQRASDTMTKLNAIKKENLKSPTNLSPQNQKQNMKSPSNYFSSQTQKQKFKSPTNSSSQTQKPTLDSPSSLSPQTQKQNLDFLSKRQKNARLQAAKIIANLKKSNEKPTLKPITETSLLEKKAEFEKLLNAQSAHMDLLNAEENQKVAEYFSNLETKERLEEKMASTFKIECRAVSCKQCGYRAFSSAERCRKEGHSLTVSKGFKRFFKCLDCSRRTVSLNILPEGSCSNCGGSRWKRVALLDDKTTSIGPTLSLRGDEEMYIGSVDKTSNLNLLVPESK